MTDPVYPEAWTARAKNAPANRKYFGMVNPVGTPGDCQNCGGLRFMYVFVSHGGPYTVPPDPPKDTHLRFIDGSWYFGHTESDPCPVCNGVYKARFINLIAGIEESQREVRLDTFKPIEGKADALKAAQYMISKIPRPSGFTTLHGLNGRGKTHLLLGIANAARVSLTPVRYVTAPDLLAEIRETYNDTSTDSAEDLIERYRGIRVLCLDELNPTKLNLTPWALEMLQTIIDKRFTNSSRLLTVIATMIPPAQIPAKWGEEWAHIASRMTGGLVVEVGGVDVRPSHGLLEKREFAEHEF